MAVNALDVRGNLFLRHADHPKRACCNIYANDEIDIGRRYVNRVLGVNDLAVSTHHLRFRCVIFEDEDEVKVAPLIYVRVLSRNPVVFSRSDSNHPSAVSSLTRDSGDVLLNHGDILQLTPLISVLFESPEQYRSSSNRLDLTKQAEVERFAKQYQVTGRILGTGGNATVYVAVKQSNQRQLACKVVHIPQKRHDATAAESRELERRVRKRRKDLAREYDVLKDLDHPNIICLEKVFCATYNIYIFQELITGGDLLSYADQMGTLGEPQTAVIIRQIAKAVDYLHSRHIVHRDIKPENILMTSWREGARIVLTDFGQARTLEDAKSAARSSAVFRMQSVVGTYGYTAPEVYQQLKRDVPKEKGYSKAIDIWSIGCITATLLTGELIFPDNNHAPDDDDQDNAQGPQEQWDLSVLDRGTAWQSSSRKAKSFVRGCLHVDETARLTAKRALLHEWFTNKHYAAEIEAAYQRAVHDWQPRSKAGNLIEFIDTTDAALAKTEPEHVKTPVEETRSHHFPPQPAPKLRPSAINTAPPKQQHYRSSAVDVVAQQTLFASPICVPDSPLAEQHTAPHSFEKLSIEDFAPPGTQFSLSGIMLPPPPDWNDSISQSQQMLDNLSAAKSQSQPDRHTISDASRKRASSFADIDELDPSLNVADRSLTENTGGAAGQRKRVHR